MNFKQYFRHHLKLRLAPIVVILAAVLILTVVIGIMEQPSKYTDYSTPDRETYPYFRSTLYIPVIFMVNLAYAFPVIEFSFFKKRRNLDCAYSLPISRRVMGAVHYLTGLLMIFAAFTLSYLANFILLLTRGPEWFNFEYLLPHYFLSLLLGLSLYSLMVFVFNEANTVGDGIWFMAAYTFVYYVVMETISALNGQGDDLILLIAHGKIQFGVFDFMTRYYQALTETRPFYYYEVWTWLSFILEFSTLIGAGVVSVLGFFFTFGKRRMEKTGEISNSFLGFRTLIPIYAVSVMLYWSRAENTNYIVAWAFIEVFTIIAYTIYHRGFHYKKSDIAILGLLVILLFI